jgi:hypothetical protein
MPISRPLFLWCEALAALALVPWSVLPTSADIAVRVSSNTHAGISLRYLAPLLLLAVAGVLCIVARIKASLGLMLNR